jgi:hypothetical protein
LTLTDHNQALNNGAIIFRNTVTVLSVAANILFIQINSLTYLKTFQVWANEFIDRWKKISDSMFYFPFTGNPFVFPCLIKTEISYE